MKRLLIIIILILGLTSAINADEKEDSLKYYVQRVSEAYDSGDYQEATMCYRNTLRLYKELCVNVSQDTVYALRLFQYADLCCKINDYNTAVELMREASSIYKNVFGIENYLYASCLDYLAYYCSLAGNYNDAIQFGFEASEICKRIFGRNHPRYAKSISHLATYYAEVENYNDAIRLGTETLEIRKRTVGIEHPDYLKAITNLANYYASIRRYDETIRLGSEVLELRKALQGANHPDYVSSLKWLANHCANNENYNDAVGLGTEAMEIIKRVKGPQHPDFAIALGNLANYYAHLGNYEKAVELGIDALEIMKKVMSPQHPDFAIILSNLANYFSYLGNYERAVEFGSTALDIHKLLYGEDNPQYIIVLCHLTDDYAYLGNYEKAVEFGNKATEIYRKLYGEEHPDYAKFINNLAIDYSVLGNYEKAIELDLQALNIQKKLFGENHLVFLKSLAYLVDHYMSLGDSEKAIELATKIQDISCQSIDKEHPDYADILNTLEYFYSDLGNYKKAIELGTQALEIRRNVFGQEHHVYARSLGSLAYDYCCLGNYDRAIELGTMALEIYKKDLGAEHPVSVSAMNNLAGFYFFNKDYVKAIEFDMQALDFRRKLFGKDHPGYATSLNNLAECYSSLGDYDEAIRLGTEAVDIMKRALNTEHPDYAGFLYNLAEYYYYRGSFNEAIPLFVESISIIRNTVFRTFSSLTVNERSLYWNKYRFKFSSSIPKIFINSGLPDVASILYDNSALFAKGLLLSTELEMTKLIQEKGDDVALQMYYELHQNRQILNAQYSKPIAERYLDCDSLERVSNNLERQLVSHVKEFGDYTRNLSITWRDVQRILNEDDIAIEFLSYADKDNEMHYAALTLCKNDTAPMLTPLFVGSKLLEASGDRETYQTAEADSLVWGPLVPRLENKSHVYFSASGMLHNIGIEYLPSVDGKECYRLSSTRELVTHKHSGTMRSATLYGDIDYDATYASIEDSIPAPIRDYAMNTTTSRHRGMFDNRSINNGVDALPSTRVELKEVSELMKSYGVPIDTLMGILASEESFKALSGQHRSLLHISTHGFYYNEEKANNLKPHLRQMLIGDDRPSYAEDRSLLRCGLCLAGANQALLGKSQPAEWQGDGVLNALEIAQIDLRGLDLVVLSACQTALGDVAQGEGVFGLQRGFKKAGAQSILMSLWEVNDLTTQLLMTEFYKHYLSGQSKLESLKKAQEFVRNYKDEDGNKPFDDPYEWAGFILLDALD